jgi:hypothetical protein
MGARGPADRIAFVGIRPPSLQRFVRFFRIQPSAFSVQALPLVPAKQYKRLDVRPLLERGEDPRGAVDAALAALRPGQGLTVLAPLLPSPLIERLKSAGYSACAQRLPDGGWRVDFVGD